MNEPNPKISRARSLRRSMTPTEAILWRHLRARGTGFKFRRQHPFGSYVLDFFCESAKLVIEIDGSQHYTDAAIARDAERSRFLEGAELHVLRVTNHEVPTQLDSVLDEIWAASRGYNPSP